MQASHEKTFKGYFAFASLSDVTTFWNFSKIFLTWEQQSKTNKKET